MVGTTLSHYKILEELGRGGMGIVYKAEDTKLDRTVAIKVLPSAALSSEDDRARFYREAKAAAQLHHPHIASVFEIDEAVPEGANTDDVRPFIAMEFIDGETLDERIQSGPLKLRDAVRMAGEIAEALKTAHAKNIVHRDIKSANVMLDAEGRAKVLDFGLAKTAQSTKLTRMGSTLGTMAYMSPEQARGEEVDHRTDVWALGAVLYEMIAGRHPFPGDYEQAVVYSILNEDPEALTAVRTGVPMSLERLVDKCLAKSADRRYQSVADLIVDLDNVTDQLQSTSSTMSRTGVSPVAPVVESNTQSTFSIKQTGVGLAAGAILMFLLVWALSPFDEQDAGSDYSEGVMRFDLSLPEDLPLAFIGDAPNSVGTRSLALSKDGKKLVYQAQTQEGSQLVSHEMSGSRFELLPGTEGAYAVTFSPDNSWIAFFADGELKKVRADGGSPISIAVASDPVGLVWSPDGFLYFADQQSAHIRRVSENGGPVETLHTGCCTVYPDYLDEQTIFVRDYWRQQVQTFDVTNKTLTSLFFDGSMLSYIPTGHLIYSNGGRLFAVPFDRELKEVKGGAVPVVENLRTESITMSGHFVVAGNGTLIYASGVNSDLVELVWKDQDGSDTPLDLPVAAYGAVRVSPDGSRIAIVESTVSGQGLELIDLRTGLKKNVVDTGVNWHPAWTNDSRRILYRSDEDDGHFVLSIDPDGSAPPDTLLRSDFVVQAYQYSPDDEWLVYGEGDSLATGVLWAVETDNYEERIQLSPFGEYSWGARFSPDGSHIAYTQVSSRRSEIIVEPFPPTGQRWEISSTGGEEPIWLANGSELIFRDGKEWKAVSYSTDPVFQASPPKVLFEGPYVNISGFEFDVGGDGRILLMRPISDALTTNKLNVIVNWYEELGRLAPLD